ncbi:MAG: hypothetical protein MR846_03920 [Tenericutes bacterium]|nr:hypothetical protein [Mycoplasmatota bacterium]MDD6941560.1 hypothetical protein [bacterium]
MNVNSLKYERNQYIQARNSAQKVAEQLGVAIQKIEEVIELQKTSYKIEDQNNANNFLTELKNTESSIYNNIVNTVIPNANYKINSLKNKIEDAMIEESIQGQN